MVLKLLIVFLLTVVGCTPSAVIAGCGFSTMKPEKESVGIHGNNNTVTTHTTIVNKVVHVHFYPRSTPSPRTKAAETKHIARIRQRRRSAPSSLGNSSTNTVSDIKQDEWSDTLHRKPRRSSRSSTSTQVTTSSLPGTPDRD